MTETRRCVLCGRELSVDRFWRAGVRGGEQRYRASCKDCEAFRIANKRAKQPADDPNTEKTCRVCGLSKPPAEFYRRTDGERDSQCKVCHKRAQVTRQQRKMQDPVYAAQFRARKRAYQNRFRLIRALRHIEFRGQVSS